MLDLLRETDPEAILVVQAANVVAVKMLEEQFDRQARFIVKHLADAFNAK